MTVRLPVDDLRRLAEDVLAAAGCASENAQAVADALIRAELDGLPWHGLERLPGWAAELSAGEIDGWAQPEATMPSPTAVRVDARGGFAFPAIAYGIAAAQETAEQMGMVGVAVVNGRHYGVAGHHVERLAERGLVALMFGNSRAAMAAWGGVSPVLGANPLAFACPRRSGAPLVIDLSLSVASRARVEAARRHGERLPEGWALDRDGRPTTDPVAALDGSLLPVCGAKGAALALAVEILAAGLTGAPFGYETGHGRYGQLILALNPDAFAAGGAMERIEALLAAVVAEEGARLPGERRLAERARRRDGITVPQALYDDLLLRTRRNLDPSR